MLSPTTRALICGSRTWDDPYPIHQVIAALPQDAVVICGGAEGADSRGRGEALIRDLSIVVYPADWAQHGKAAGPLRNQKMLSEGKPTVVWAFIDKPLEESRGTADMVRRAKEAGVPVYLVSKG